MKNIIVLKHSNTSLGMPLFLTSDTPSCSNNQDILPDGVVNDVITTPYWGQIDQGRIMRWDHKQRVSHFRESIKILYTSMHLGTVKRLNNFFDQLNHPSHEI